MSRNPLVVSVAACLSGAIFATSLALASPPTVVAPKAPPGGPIQYTVKILSKPFNKAQQTRTISSGQTDDFTFSAALPGPAMIVDHACPGRDSLPLDASGALVRQTHIRLAPVVSANGMATVQLSFQALASKGSTFVEAAGGKRIRCPKPAVFSQISRFMLPTNGRAKTLTFNDGSQISVSARH